MSPLLFHFKSWVKGQLVSYVKQQLVQDDPVLLAGLFDKIDRAKRTDEIIDAIYEAYQVKPNDVGSVFDMLPAEFIDHQ